MVKTATTDEWRRIVLPDARPGEVYAIRQVDEAHIELSRLRAAPGKPRGRLEVEALLNSSGLTPAMSWDVLRRLTREP